MRVGCVNGQPLLCHITYVLDATTEYATLLTCRLQAIKSIYLVDIVRHFLTGQFSCRAGAVSLLELEQKEQPPVPHLLAAGMVSLLGGKTLEILLRTKLRMMTWSFGQGVR